MTAPMLGPVVGGFLVTYVNWRWIFYLNLPVGLASLAFSWLVLKEHREAAGRFDPLGFVLSGGGLAAILYALSEGAQFGWTTPIVLLSAAVSVVCFSLLVVVERRIKFPLLDLGLYASSLFRTSNLIAIGFFAAQFGLVFLLPLFLQEIARAVGARIRPDDVSAGDRPDSDGPGDQPYLLAPRRPAQLDHQQHRATVTAALFLLVGLDTDLWWIAADAAARLVHGVQHGGHANGRVLGRAA